MPSDKDSLIQECPTCGALIDASGEEPFAMMHCPTCGGAMRVRRQFNHFELQERLGSGGMGTVYRALDQNLGRQVALKLLQPQHSTNPEFIAQFEKEAAITASINHPHVVKVYSTGTDHGLVYIAMELVDKGSLDDLLDQEGRLPETQVLSVGIQIAQGLNAALQRGLIHRDVKPGNILFANVHTAKIVDFGLAVLMEHAGTVMGEVWGTPAYVAPEKLDNKPEDLRSDIYSLGASLFHALTGEPPCNLDTDSMSELLAAKRTPPDVHETVPDVGSATAHVIAKALKFDPADRFQTYEELIENLEFARHQLAEAQRKAEAESFVTNAPAKDLSWLTYTVAVLVVGGGLAAHHFRDRIFPRGEDAAAEDSRSGIGIDGKYQAARMLLAGSDPKKAAAAFRSLESLPDVPQPRLNWITLHAGLAEYLAGDVAGARADFAKMEQRGLFSKDLTEQELANFFVETAKLAGAEEPVATDAIKDMDPDSYKAVALFVFAAKDWALGDYDSAGKLFRQFAAATPPSGFAWIAEYKTLATPYLADYAGYRTAADAAAAAATPAQREQAITALDGAKAKLVMPGKLGERLAALADDLRAKVAKDKEAMERQMAAQEEADAKAVAETKAKLGPLCQQFKFTEAHAAALATPVQTAKAKAELAVMLKKTEWLAKFKSTLISDLSTTGYAAALVKKNGLQVPGGVRRANDTQAEIVSQFGSVPVPWTEVSFDCIFAIGQSFLRTPQTSDQLSDREWLLGVFAYFAGKEAQGRELLIQASQGKAEYRDHLGLFIGTVETQ